MDKQIFKKLILPLSLLTIMSFILNCFFSFYGFFINLSTELISIIITVLYVDYIIKKRELENWINVEKQVSGELRIYINATISTIRTAFNIDIFNLIKYPINIDAMNQELIKFSKEILEPNTLKKVSNINQNEWKIFINQILNLRNEGDRLLTIFNAKLNPQQYEYFLLIQYCLKSIHNSYSIFPDIIGIPDNELPMDNIDQAIELKESFNVIISNEIIDLLSNCRNLSSYLSDLK